ncbi:MAG: TnpV protein [Ruminococcus sp.]
MQTKTVNGLEYIKDKEGYWRLNLELPKIKLNSWGIMRKDYLKENDPVEYEMLMITGEMLPHLDRVQTQAQEMMDTLIEQKKKEQGVNEELKAKDWLKFVQMATNIQEEARQTVLRELIYI